MNEKLKVLLSKLASIERAISEEKGPLVFFAFLKPYGSIESWDLVVSATWSNGDEHFDAIKYIVDKLYAVCVDAELVTISQVVILETDHPDLDDILEDFDVEHGMIKMKYSHYFDQEFERGYLFTCKIREAAAPLAARQNTADQSC